jgi:hypothetical protein
MFLLEEEYLMSLPIVWTTQKAAILTAMKNAGGVLELNKSTILLVHFSSSQARTDFKAAIVSVPKKLVVDSDHQGIRCVTVTPTA